jgi:hypothetical protein
MKRVVNKVIAVCAILGIAGILQAQPTKDNTMDAVFQKGPFASKTIKPLSIYQINIDGISQADMTLLSVLQGVIAQQSPEQIYLYQTKSDYYQPNKADTEEGLNTDTLFWLHYLTKNPIGPKFIEKNLIKNNNVWDAVSHFKQDITGYVVYDLNTPSENLAATLCGISGDSIPVATQEQIAHAKSLNLTETANLTNISDYQAFFSQYETDINKSFAIELTPGASGGGGPIDYAAMLKGMVFWSGETNTVRDAILSAIGDKNSNPIPVYGWNSASGNEGDFVNGVGKNGDFVVASDNSVNLSFFASSKTKTEKVKNIIKPITYNKEKKYVTFIVSDGDNLQFVTNKANDQRWWGSQYRGDFPVGWTIPPAMSYLEPDVWNYFVNTATKNDELVAGPSGIGFVFGSVTNMKKQQEYLKEFMEATGVKTTCIFGDTASDWKNNSFMEAYTENTAVIGAFYSQFSGWMSQTDYQTKWSNDKPIVPENIFLNNHEPSSNIDNAVSKIENSSAGSLFAVYAIRNDPDNTMDWLNELNNKLKGKNVQVVLPSQLIDLECQAAGHPRPQL